MQKNWTTLALATLVLGATLFTTGCATKRIAPMQKEITTTDEQVNGLLRKIDRGGAAQPARPVAENVDGIWLPVRKVRDSELQSAAYKVTSRRFSVNREFHTLRDVAERVTLLIGVPVTLAPELQPEGQAATNTVSPPGGAPGSVTPFAMTGSQYSLSGNVVPLSYDGPLSGFLDVVAARFGAYWEWSGDSIRFYRFTTRTFRLSALPGETSTQNLVSNTTGGSSSGGGSNSSTSETNQKTQIESRLSVWQGVLDSIKGMLSKTGSSVTVTAATGSVTVTDTPEVLARVEKFIEQQNAALSKQVVINVRVLSVDLNDGENYGINWDVVYRSMAGNMGFRFKNSFFDPGSTTNPTLNLNVLSSAGRVGQDPNGALTGAKIATWAGSQALINALSSQGQVSQITSASLTTLNNQAAPLQVGRQTTYLASSTTTVTQGAGTTTTLQPGMLTTGFSMSIVPHIFDRGQLMLQYAIDISSLLGMYTVSSNNSSIQAPDVDTRNFMQRVLLTSGDTLVMTGFEQAVTNASSSGMGRSNNTMLGGGVSGKRNRSVLVILIQPITAE